MSSVMQQVFIFVAVVRMIKHNNIDDIANGDRFFSGQKPLQNALNFLDCRLFSLSSWKFSGLRITQL